MKCQRCALFTVLETSGFNTKLSQLFIPNNAVPPGSQEELDEYIKKEELEPAKTILFRQPAADVVEMLIPSQYLEKSPSNPANPSGENSLSLKVSCYSLSKFNLISSLDRIG